ncbi:lanthionine synthetase LanC family protein [Facklamia miroungae]|uniref:lanthionine synthetase LanC family protein n=1 Tax=Facklamia miroungae TaxID=120956 RepID=UPI0031834119
MQPILDYWATTENVYLDYSHDLIYGVSGVFLFIGNHSLINNDEVVKFDGKSNFIIDMSFEILFRVNCETDNFYKLYTKNNKKNYCILGMAHGICGLISSLKILQNKMNYNIQKKIDILSSNFEKFVIKYAKIKNSKVKVPVCIKLDKVFSDDPNDIDILKNNYTWCYGIVGLGIYFNKFSKDKNLISLLNNNIECTMESIIENNYNNLLNEDLCICHGYSGMLYYCFNETSKNSLNNDILCNFLNACLENYNIKDKTNLLNGYGGIKLVLESLKNNKRFIGDFLFGY